MRYRFAAERLDYSDYASGRVLRGLPGQPAFPVRLASEVFRRCLAARQAQGARGRCVLYDPCCGGAYHLATLGLLHRDCLERIVASDVSGEALSLAESNLALLTVAGLEQRLAEISAMLAAYGKESHAAALESGRRLMQRLREAAGRRPLETRLFCADARDGAALREGLGGGRVDVVFADVPYGKWTSWQGGPVGGSSVPPVEQLLEALLGVLAPAAVVAVACDKGQRAAHAGYRRLERIRAGKRQVFILTVYG